MLSSRLNAFVIPTSQITPSGTAIQSLPTISTVKPAPQRDRSCPELRPELRPGGKRVQVVDEPREEEHRAADQHAPQLRARLERTGRERDEGTGEQPGEDAEPADERGLLLVPAIGARRSGKAAEDGGTERRPDHRVRGSQGGDRSERDHTRKGRGGLLPRCMPNLASCGRRFSRFSAVPCAHPS